MRVLGREHARRLAAGRVAKRDAGGYAGGRPPYGWRSDRGELVAVGAEQAVVGFVVDARAQDPPLSYRAIVEVLEAAGVPGPAGGRWSPMAVRRVAERGL